MSGDDSELDISTEEESSSSSSEDEDGKEWTEEHEKTFFKTLSSLKSKDPSIYDENIKFFDDSVSKQSEESSSLLKSKPEEKPIHLRDYERKIILEKKGILTEEDSDHDIYDDETNRATLSHTYVEEQKSLKREFVKLVNEKEESSSDDEETTAGFLKVKIKNTEQKAKEDAEYVEWLKGQKLELNDEETENRLKYLRDYWVDPNLNQEEKFLRDYILDKKYLEASNENPFEQEVSFSEEEKILEECEEYEHKYNFRFEEPDENFIKTYPRVIEDSLRRKDEKRKHKREERKKRKQETLLQKHVEVKRLKKQKKQEIEEKIKELKKLTGNETVGFDDEDLNQDFDPDEYDRKMNELFNEEFYQNEDDDFQPNLHFDEEEAIDCPLYSDSENKDTFSNQEDNDEENSRRESKFKKQTRASRRKGHKRTTFAEVLQKPKPLFDPEDKTFQQYVDEYYGLDFEDVIDDLPCRFKYRKVLPNDFGLSIEEILAADDKELNNWCTMKKIDTIRPEQNEKFDKKIYKRRAENLELKKKFLPSLFAEVDTKNDDYESNKNELINEKNQQNEGGASCSKNQNTKRKKRKGKRGKKGNTLKTDSEPQADGKEVQLNKQTDRQPCSNESKSRKRNMKANHFEDGYSKKLKRDSFKITNLNGNKKRQFNLKDDSNPVITDERLKAYGLNPKKYKNKIKYSQSQK